MFAARAQFLECKERFAYADLGMLFRQRSFCGLLAHTSLFVVELLPNNQQDEAQ